MLVLALVVDSLGNGLFLPLSLIFFLALSDVPLTLLGALLTAATAITLPVPIWAGALADRFGALPVVVAAQVVQAVGFIAYAHVAGAVSVFAAAGLVAVGVRLFWSAIFTALADYAQNSAGTWALDTWYSVSNGARTAGLAAGGLVTGVVLADGRAGTYIAVAYAAAICFAAAAGLIAAFVRIPHTAQPVEPDQADEAGGAGGYRVVLRDRAFVALVGVNTIFALASILLGLALPTVVKEVLDGPGWLTAAVLAGNALAIAALAAPVGARLPRYRRTRVLAAAAGLWCAWALGMAALGSAPRAGVAVALVAVTVAFTAAELIHAPASTALAAAVAPARLRGRYLATFQYSFTIASLIAPVFFTTLFAAAPAAPWLVLAALVALGGIAVLRLERTFPPGALRHVGPAGPQTI